MRARLFGVLAAALVFACVRLAFAQGDEATGQVIYTQKCATCHSMPTDPAHGAKGPSLMDVVGRTAGSIRGWDFSPALRASGLEFHPRPKPYLVWTEANLDKWLTDSGVFVPGSRHMNLKMPDPLERAKVIAYLRSLTKPIDGASLP